VPVASDRIRASLTVVNAGNLAARSVSVFVYASVDDVFGPEDYPVSVGHVSVDGVEAGETRTVPMTLSPYDSLGRTGPYRLFAVVNGLQVTGELDATNNVSMGPLVTMPAAKEDTSVGAFPVSTESLNRGRGGGVLPVRLRVGTLTYTPRRGPLVVQLLQRTGGTDDAPELTPVATVVRRVRLRPKAAKSLVVRVRPAHQLAAGSYFVAAGFGGTPDEAASAERRMLVAGPLAVA
jgi:hypothetical protein